MGLFFCGEYMFCVCVCSQQVSHTRLWWQRSHHWQVHLTSLSLWLSTGRKEPEQDAAKSSACQEAACQGSSAGWWWQTADRTGLWTRQKKVSHLWHKEVPARWQCCRWSGLNWCYQDVTGSHFYELECPAPSPFLCDCPHHGRKGWHRSGGRGNHDLLVQLLAKSEKGPYWSCPSQWSHNGAVWMFLVSWIYCNWLSGLLDPVLL